MNAKRERLIKLFTFYKPYTLRYARLKKEHRDDADELRKMMKEGLVEIVEKDRRSILYLYKGPVGQLG
jgi:hypothetical protein